jgi:tetratricopeptide (TPR) repeat protein
VNSFYRITSKTAPLALSFFAGCRTQDPYQSLATATITYPFAESATPLGTEDPEDKFIIRTMAGNTEYVVEIPKAGADYDIEVPIAEMKGSELPSKTKNPYKTDKELVNDMPKVNAQTEAELALLNKAFGVGEKDGPKQSPSYIMGIAKINGYYKERNYEYALIEINNLLTYYPTSEKLYKMKGTVLVKLGNLELAEKSWLRASELDPTDAVVRKGIDRLRKQITFNNQAMLNRQQPTAPRAN